jgi:E3 ubiquitin-protein ligase SDIR1
MSFSSYSKQKMLDSANESKKGTEDELTCSVCLEQVTVGEIVRTLPCLHQVSIFTFILN